METRRRFVSVAISAAITLAGVLLCGCGQSHSSHYEAQSITWFYEYTNLELTIIYQGVQTKTNVDSLDQAASILAPYGWQVVSKGGDNENHFMTLQRRYRGNDECTFALMPPNAFVPPPPAAAH